MNPKAMMNDHQLRRRTERQAERDHRSDDQAHRDQHVQQKKDDGGGFGKAGRFVRQSDKIHGHAQDEYGSQHPDLIDGPCEHALLQICTGFRFDYA